MMLNNYGEVIKDASLLSYNTYGINTSCKYLVKPHNIDKLKELFVYLSSNNLKYYILGKGSNVILPDNKFDGVIISLEKINDFNISDNYVCASAGIILSSLVMECINNNLAGLECLASIPGTLGGALVGNAGANGQTIYDHVTEVEVLRNNEIITLKKVDIDVSYRHTIFKENNDIILSATFQLNKGNKETMQNIVKENRIKRINSQPLEYKNAGSVFRNPEGDYAGRLIEELGLKGFCVNDAEVSMKHANFIVNKGNATGEDIRKLIKIIKDKVKEKYNIDLVLEQIIVDWD